MRWPFRFGRIYQSLSLILLMLTINGCSLFGEKNDLNRAVISSSTNKALEIPPDLITPATNDKYSLPASGEARLSDFSDLDSRKFPSENSRLLPAETEAYFINYGGFKVLLIERSPEEIWGLLKSFWMQNGFQIEKEMPEVGFIETAWLESREKISDGLIRNTLGKIFGGLYDTGEKNKFRMRIERTEDGFSEISVVHKGLIQVASDDRFDPTIVWANRNADQQLEELYLRRIINFVSGKENQNGKDIDVVKKSPSTLKGNNDNTFVELALNFNEAWKSIGLILDRLGFEVEERLREQGTYLIRYKKLDKEEKKKGFFAKIFSSDKEQFDMNLYRIEIKNSGNMSQVFVSDHETSERTKSSQNILAVIYEQLN
ncbi:outer membrane protein assembly factor BamC [Betaproteobacteria bacterium]|nr:outer membrane protein assembly factor BamC [Betaproteobacteria bacterium]